MGFATVQSITGQLSQVLACCAIQGKLERVLSEFTTKTARSQIMFRRSLRSEQTGKRQLMFGMFQQKAAFLWQASFIYLLESLARNSVFSSENSKMQCQKQRSPGFKMACQGFLAQNYSLRKRAFPWLNRPPIPRSQHWGPQSVVMTQSLLSEVLEVSSALL